MARIASEVAICLILALACGAAGAGERVSLQGSDATVVVPAGWMVAPVLSDPPTVHLWACDPAVTDGCQLLAEMDIERLYGERAPVSLDGVIAGAAAANDRPSPSEHAFQPRKLKIAGFDAVETFSVGDVIYDYAGGGADTGKKAYRFITLQAGAAFYRCTVSTSQLANADRWRAALIEFCSSLNVAQSESTSGKQ